MKKASNKELTPLVAHITQSQYKLIKILSKLTTNTSDTQNISALQPTIQ